MDPNPPFKVEETDEDFFDKLVDDDFKSSTVDGSAQISFEGNDSDDARDFSNLSLGEEFGGESGFEELKTNDDSINARARSPEVAAEEENRSNTQGVDGFIESSSEVNVSKTDTSLARPESVVPEGIVKEVGWSSFYTGSDQNESNGFDSYSDPFCDLGESENAGNETDRNNGGYELTAVDNSTNNAQSQGSKFNDTNGHSLNSSQDWENMYPGWKFNQNTGQWYQVEGYDATTNVQESYNTNSGNESTAVKSEVSYLQQSVESVVGTVPGTGSNTTQSVSSWNKASQLNNGYPENMIFDPQYPGWYYDTIVQQWLSLESYTSSIQSTTFEGQAHQQQNQNGTVSTNINGMSGENVQVNNYALLDHNSHKQYGRSADAYDHSYNHQSTNMWQPATVTKTEAFPTYKGYEQMENSYGAQVLSQQVSSQQDFISPVRNGFTYDKTSQGHVEANGFIGAQSFIPTNFSPNHDQMNVKQNAQVQFSHDFQGTQNPIYVAPQSFQSSQQFGHPPNVGQSTAGRPPHALVTFGFGGKLIVMKETASLNSSYGGQESAGVGCTISMLNLMEVVSVNNDEANTSDYFRALCHQSFPGPLVGGNAGSKELNKWIDERVSNCVSHDMDYRKGKGLKLMLSLLKIAYQHYGKLRSPLGFDTTLKEGDIPETAVAKLFASAKMNGNQYSQYGARNQCLLNFPSEEQVRATASEVQSLLVSGRKIEALQCAQEGQFWGPALVLASQLGEQFYVNTVKQMALNQLVAGSPLRTLCLLIAGQPADVFSANTTAFGGLPGAMNVPQQPAQFGANGMLDDWEENLAVVTANRTKDDNLVILHLGDCLWRERSEITAAHICYLVAEAEFESYSDSARLCLVGADHLKFPRTYASPEAIQRTEFYEYSKVLGNSQFILLPFQPYKLIYAHMLAEIGKFSDSLKYCQSVLRSLKTGRSAEVETWKQLVLSLEERIKTHQQSGYAANLAPAKIVGKLLNFIDSTAHRVVGGLPPPASTTLLGIAQGNDPFQQPIVPRVSASQSTTTMSSLMPSASMEPISEWATDGSKKTVPNRSVSEPDFGRSPSQVHSSKTSTSAQGKSGGTSRFSRFGFGSQLLQKTVGYVMKPRSDKQAKLGESNKFYYNEKLKRWVEEGAELPAEEPALAPPPTVAPFQNGTPDYNLKSVLKSEVSPKSRSPKFRSSPSETSGIPPIPTSSNQFSARGRMGVRARYVDTFNKGGGNQANMYQSPSFQSTRPAASANAKFFVPSPTPSNEQNYESISEENSQERATPNENSFPSTIHSPIQTPPPSSSSTPTMQRFPSMDHITHKGQRSNFNEPYSSPSRRTASWSGSFADSSIPPKIVEMRPNEKSRNNGGFGDDLDEVEL